MSGNNGKSLDQILRAAKNSKKLPGVPAWPANAKVPYEEAARLADQWLSIGHTKGEVKRRLMAKYDIVPRSAERVLSRARKIARRRMNMTTDDLRWRSHDVYQAIISSDDSTPADKIKAQTRLDKLYGIIAPQRLELGGKVQITSDDAADLLKDEDNVEMLDLLAERLYKHRQTQGKN